MIEVNCTIDKEGKLPVYATKGSAGADLHAMLDAPVTILPGERKLIKTGLHVALPEGYEMQIRPRSGLAYKHGITVLNAPGTIDSDYRGDVGVILINHGSNAFEVNPGDRIAQMVVAPYIQANMVVVESLDDTERGDGGFGSSGMQSL